MALHQHGRRRPTSHGSHNTLARQAPQPDRGLSNEALIGLPVDAIVEALLRRGAPVGPAGAAGVGFGAGPTGVAPDPLPAAIPPAAAGAAPVGAVDPATIAAIGAIVPPAIGALGSIFGGDDDPTNLSIRRGRPQVVDIFSQLGIQGQDRADINAQLAPLILARLLSLLIPAGASPDLIASLGAPRGDPATNPNTERGGLPLGRQREVGQQVAEIVSLFRSAR